MKITNKSETQNKYINFECNSKCCIPNEEEYGNNVKEFFIEYWKKNGTILEKTCILKDSFDSFQRLMAIKLNNFVKINRIIEKNSDFCATIKVGSLWDGNKLGDIIFREVCYNNEIFIPVFLNYSIDNAETISYKLSVADCQILLFDVDIPKSFIDEISNTFSNNYGKRIFILPSDQVFSSNNIYIKSNSFNNVKNSTNNNSLKISLNSENHLENLYESNKTRSNKFQEFKILSNEFQSSTFALDFNKTENNCSYVETIDGTSNIEKNSNIANLELNSKIRSIVFTSGSTGKPKGVKLTFGNYLGMISTLSVLFNNNNDTKSIFVITNPLHHVNSTCFTEYCVRNSSKLVLIHKYSKDYWQILNKTIEYSINNYGNNFCMIVPLVPKHFEYFCSMVENNYFEDQNKLLINLSHPSVNFFFGSSAVSNDLINEFKKLFKEKVPRVRFGSTETCLQLCGTDLLMHHSLLDAANKLKNEYEDVYPNSIKKDGYFIGRSIQPFAEISVVKSTDLNSSNFLVPTSEFEIGQIICRGNTIMSGYINHENVLITRGLVKKISNADLNLQTPKSVFICDKHPWYIGLGDQGYWTTGEIKNISKQSTVYILGEEKQVTHITKSPKAIIEEKLNSCACCENNIFVDNMFLYWFSRSSSIIKIGGVKYTSEEINNRIVSVLKSLNKVTFPKSFFSTVVCNKSDKISGDDKILFVYEPFEGSKNLEKLIKDELICSKIPKSYIPYKIIETTIPKTFKGSVDKEKLLEKINSELG